MSPRREPYFSRDPSEQVVEGPTPPMNEQRSPNPMHNAWVRKCPTCHGGNVRRSSTPASEVTWRNEVLSPYRCRDCLMQFWVISRKAHIVAGGIMAAIVVTAIAILLLLL